MNNNRNTRIESAKQTLQIIKDKQYTIHNKVVNLADKIDYSVSNTGLYTSEALGEIQLSVDKNLINENRETVIKVENSTSMQAAERLVSSGKTGCLNFASAKNPGGGFMSGAQAQEESLARASALYPSQIKFYDEMYEYNRKRNTYLYSDRMIYSPAVCFFKDDNDNLLPEAYCMDIVTSPAVNIGAMYQNRKTEEIPLVKETMLRRIDKILALFYTNGVKHLILGAWGCGVFRNNPEDIAGYFAHYIKKGGKYGNCFDTVVFAVYDNSKKQENISAFEKVF